MRPALRQGTHKGNSMIDDREIVAQNLDLKARGKDYALTELPSFLQWCNEKSIRGGNESAIDHMFAMSMYLLPEEVSVISNTDFDELYENIIDDLE